jgi:hypothetical protein
MSGERAGTWDHTEDADEILKRSGEPYVLATAQDGSSI